MAIKGVKFSEEHKKKLKESAALRAKETYKGKKFQKGTSPWNKGIPTSEEARKKQSESKLRAGIKPPPRTGCKPWNFGKLGEYSTSSKGRPREDIRGEKCRLWKGGKTGDGLQRGRVENSNWKKACLERDEHKCKVCDTTKSLVVHHIKCWKKYPELRFDIDNGVTLCRSCHAAVHWEIGNIRI